MGPLCVRTTKARQPRPFPSRTERNQIFSCVLFVTPDARSGAPRWDGARIIIVYARLGRDLEVLRPPPQVLRDDKVSHSLLFCLINLTSTGFSPSLPLSLNRAPCLFTRKHRFPTHPLFHPAHSTSQPTQQAQLLNDILNFQLSRGERV